MSLVLEPLATLGGEDGDGDDGVLSVQFVASRLYKVARHLFCMCSLRRV